MFWLRIKSRTQEIESLRARRAAPSFGESALALRRTPGMSVAPSLEGISRGRASQSAAFCNAVRPAGSRPDRPPSRCTHGCV